MNIDLDAVVSEEEQKEIGYAIEKITDRTSGIFSDDSLKLMDSFKLRRFDEKIGNVLSSIDGFINEVEMDVNTRIRDAEMYLAQAKKAGLTQNSPYYKSIKSYKEVVKALLISITWRNLMAEALLKERGILVKKWKDRQNIEMEKELIDRDEKRIKPVLDFYEQKFQELSNPFVCEVCKLENKDARFANMEMLEFHMSRNHKGEEKTGEAPTYEPREEEESKDDISDKDIDEEELKSQWKKVVDSVEKGLEKGTPPMKLKASNLANVANRKMSDVVKNRIKVALEDISEEEILNVSNIDLLK